MSLDTTKKEKGKLKLTKDNLLIIISKPLILIIFKDIIEFLWFH